METMTSKETTSDAAVKRLKSLGFDEEQIYTLQTGLLKKTIEQCLFSFVF